MFYLIATVGWFLTKKKINNATNTNLGVKYKDWILGSSWGESSRHSKMAAEPTREWSDEQLKSDELPKKDVIKFIQDNAAHSVCLPICCLCGITFKKQQIQLEIRLIKDTLNRMLYFSMKL